MLRYQYQRSAARVEQVNPLILKESTICTTNVPLQNVGKSLKTK